MTRPGRLATISPLPRKGQSTGHRRCSWYNLIMSTKLSAANPYLRDPIVRKNMTIRSVVTSSAIEGIRAVFKQARQDTPKSALRKLNLKRKKA
jgi:hypothetical protein